MHSITASTDESSPCLQCDNTGAVVMAVVAVVVIITGVVMVMTYLVLRYKKGRKM